MAKLMLRQQNKGLTWTEVNEKMKQRRKFRSRVLVMTVFREIFQMKNDLKVDEAGKNSEKKYKLKKFFKDHKLLALAGEHVAEGQENSSMYPLRQKVQKLALKLKRQFIQVRSMLRFEY